jgi:hypothetical protein
MPLIKLMPYGNHRIKRMYVKERIHPSFKETMSRDGWFLRVKKFYSVLSRKAQLVSNVFNCFLSCYTNITFLASMKLLTENETILRIPFIAIGRCSPLSTPTDCSENAPKFTFGRYDFTGSHEAASCMQLQRQNCCRRVSEEGYWKDFQN